MKELKITKRLKECNLSEIEKLEQEFNVQLPEYLKTFILKYGSARVYENWTNKKWYIDTFLNPYDSKNVDMAMIIPQLRHVEGDELDIARYDLVPFAYEIGSWYFCLSIGEKDYGHVYITGWDEETQTNLIKLANSFEDFINSLQRDLERDMEIIYSNGESTARYWIANYIINKDYKEGIQKLKTHLSNLPYGQEDIEGIKMCLRDKRFGYMDSALQVFKSLGVNLKENTEAEAYKCIELFIKNLELEDESQIVEYPLFKETE
jgi:SMI1-KNR4 cell-wall